MSTIGLGRLISVDVREVWKSEPADFTPWLSQADNLALLGDTIGIELEMESQEKDVGPFRADILCKDTSTGDWVLIENQLAKTDHTHLGQLMTYAAGLNAVTIVWIAQRFTEEHRAALDWLNEITDERFTFFGIEVELWQIGNSASAPKFNLISKPNDWRKAVSNVVSRAEPSEISETRGLYFEYWSALAEYLEDKNSKVRIKRPNAGGWVVFSIGRTGFILSARVSQNKRTSEVLFILYEPNRLAKFRHFLLSRADIESKLGMDLEWRELPERKESHIRRVFPDTDPGNRADWPRQHELLCQTLEQFEAVFRPLVRAIDEAELDSVQ